MAQNLMAQQKVKQREQIQRTLDRICGIDHAVDSLDKRRTHRMLGLTIVISVLLCFVFAFQIYLNLGYLEVNVLVMVVIAISSLLNLAALAWRRNLRQTIVVFLVMSYVLLTFLHYNNGGLDATGIAFYLVLPIFAMFLLGTRPAIVVTAVITLTLLVFFAMEQSGFVFPRILDEEPTRRLWLLSQISVLGYITIIAWFFEVSRRTSFEQMNSTLDQLTLLNQELTQARDDAQAAAQAKSAFLASMSHEIRTPLNGVIGMTSLLLETPLTAEQQEFTRTIRTSGDTLLTLINDILDFSKVEAGKVELESLPFDLRTCIEDVLDLLSTKALTKDLELLYTISPATPMTVVGDVTRLRQILMNLVANGIKFTEAGEVVVEVNSHSLGDGLHQLQFAVRDTGIGIPPDRTNRLFQSFSQIDASTTRRFGGTGLGLAISKQLIELMGGTIWVESQPGAGSTFYFTLLCNEAEQRPDQPKLPPLSEKKLPVLVVDDNATNREILYRQLTNWGLQPTLAASAHEALSTVAESAPFALIVLDMHMPEMDGLMLAEKLQRLYRDTPKFSPLILLSSVSERLDDNTSRIFAATVVKPVKTIVLYQTLKDALSHATTPKVAQPPKIATLWQDIASTLPLRILVVEDNQVNQMVALRMLERMGYRADVVGNGLEVLESLKRQTYDMIFMDIQMPEMDGEETTMHIRRRNDDFAQPLIVAMTANAFTEDRQRYLDMGMDGFISKPVRLQELADVITSLHPASTQKPQSGSLSA